MICPTCKYPHVNPLGCGSCGWKPGDISPETHPGFHPEVLAEVHPMNKIAARAIKAAVVGFAGPAVEAQPEPEAAVEVVEEVVAPAVEVEAPVQAEDPLQQPESKRTPRKRTTVN